jgi:S-adenosyl methyltransferase
MYDYFLGGKDNFAADRDTASKALTAWPAMRTAARENRAFLGRASGVELTGGGVVGFTAGGHPCADRLLAGTVPGHYVSFRHGPTHPPGCNDASQGNARVSDPCPRRQVQRG